MANAAKYNGGQTGGLTRHYERHKKEDGEYQLFKNQDIDTSRSHLNYNLAPERDGGQLAFIKQRCSEVKCQNRADVNVMVSWVVTAPKGLSEEECERFFQESYKFLNDRYGQGTDKNVISAYVHRDENQPHMHYAFVPVVTDKKKGHEKVSAKEAVARYDLQTFHPDLDEHMTAVFGRDIGVMNEATKDGNKTIEELKQETKIIQSEVRPYRQLKTDIENVGEKAKAVKIPFTDKTIVLENTADRQTAIEQAKTYIANRDALRDVRKRSRTVSDRESAVADRESAVGDRESAADKRDQQLKSRSRSLDDREGRIALKEKESDIVSMREEVLRTQEEIKGWCRVVIRLQDENEQLKKQIPSLEAKIGTLQDELIKARENITEKIREAYKGFKSAIEALNMLKYGFNDGKSNPYKAKLTDEQGRLIDGITNQASNLARTNGFSDIADDMKNRIGLSEDIKKSVKALEPKQQSRDDGPSR